MIEQNQERVKLIKNGSLEVLHKEDKTAEGTKKSPTILFLTIIFKCKASC